MTGLDEKGMVIFRKEVVYLSSQTPGSRDPSLFTHSLGKNAMNRIFKTGAITLYTCVVLIIAGGFAAYELVQGLMWKQETKRFAESAGRSEAMNLFKKGYRWKYVIDGKRDQNTRLNRMDGQFQPIAVFYQPSLGSAHKFATETFVSAFNGQMDTMIVKPERFLGGPNNSGANRSQPTRVETNQTSMAAGSDR